MLTLDVHLHNNVYLHNISQMRGAKNMYATSDKYVMHTAPRWGPDVAYTRGGYGLKVEICHVTSRNSNWVISDKYFMKSTQLTLIFGCFNISSTIIPDLTISCDEKFAKNLNDEIDNYPLNAATQRGASPNSFKWFGSSPRVASSFTMSVYLQIVGFKALAYNCHLLPFAVILFPQYGLYGGMEDKFVFSRTFGAGLKKE